MNYGVIDRDADGGGVIKISQKVGVSASIGDYLRRYFIYLPGSDPGSRILPDGLMNLINSMPRPNSMATYLLPDAVN